MDVVEFLKKRTRMCEYTNYTCLGCPISDARRRRGDLCWPYITENPEECVAIVEKWAQEHPIKTNGQKFDELFKPDTTEKWYRDCKSSCNTRKLPCAFCPWWGEEYKGPREEEENE